LLADLASHVIGVDMNQEAIQQAAEKYVKPNLEFICGPADAIPIDGLEVFDVIVCFETIEHLDEATQLKFMDEVRRLLRPDGKFIVSTPNKLFYTDKSSYNNEFHLKEFYFQEFIDFLRRFFNVAYLLGQRIYPVSYVWPLQASQQQLSEYQLKHVDGHFEPAGTDAKEVLYVLAVCSNLEFDPPGHSLLLDNSDQAISQRVARLVEQEKAINALRAQIAEYQAQLQKDAADIATLQSAVVARDAQLQKDATDIATLQAQVVMFQTENAEQRVHIAQLRQHSQDLAAQVAYLNASLEAIHRSLAWRIA